MESQHTCLAVYRAARADFADLTILQQRDHLRAQGIDPTEMSCKEDGDDLVFTSRPLTKADREHQHGVLIAGDAVAQDGRSGSLCCTETSEIENGLSGQKIGECAS